MSSRLWNDDGAVRFDFLEGWQSGSRLRKWVAYVVASWLPYATSTRRMLAAGLTQSRTGVLSSPPRRVVPFRDASLTTHAVSDPLIDESPNSRNTSETIASPRRLIRLFIPQNTSTTAPTMVKVLPLFPNPRRPRLPNSSPARQTHRPRHARGRLGSLPLLYPLGLRDCTPPP